MKNAIISCCLAIGILLSPAKAAGQDSAEPSPRLGEAAVNGKTSAAAIAWATIGVGFLIAIGIVIAISLSKDNKNH